MHRKKTLLMEIRMFDSIFQKPKRTKYIAASSVVMHVTVNLHDKHDK